MRAILLPSERHSKSSRGTPRLRRMPRVLHGAVRLTSRTTTLNLGPLLVEAEQDTRPCLPCSSFIRALPTFPKRAFASCGRSCRCLAPLDWPALRPALSEIRLSLLAECPSASSRCIMLDWNSWLFRSRRQAHFLLAKQTAGLLMPDVRGKRAPTAGRQARAGENVQRTTGPGLVACRWRSA